MSKNSPLWIGNPNSQPREYITLCDILTVGTNSPPGDTTNSTSYTLGSAVSGEVYSSNAMQFNPPGLISLPLPPGSYNSSGVFTPSNTSQTGGQAICYVRNDQYTILGTRDVRNQNIPGNIQAGETCLYGQLGLGTVTCKNDNTVTIGTIATSETYPSGSAGQNVQFTVGPTGLYFTSPWGTMAFDSAGFRVSTSSGGTFSITNSPTSSTACFINSGSFAVNSSLITLGTGTSLNPFGAAYSLIPVTLPGVAILAPGFVTQAAASTTVFIAP